MEPAKLNPEFIKKPEVCLENLKPGESGWVFWNEMAVDQEYRCYIDPKAVVTQLTLSMIRVTCTDEGFEVLIPASPLAPLRWRLGAYNLEADEKYAPYMPVIKVEYAKTEASSRVSNRADGANETRFHKLRLAGSFCEPPLPQTRNIKFNGVKSPLVTSHSARGFAERLILRGPETDPRRLQDPCAPTR